MRVYQFCISCTLRFAVQWITLQQAGTFILRHLSMSHLDGFLFSLWKENLKYLSVLKNIWLILIAKLWPDWRHFSQMKKACISLRNFSIFHNSGEFFHDDLARMRGNKIILRNGWTERFLIRFDPCWIIIYFEGILAWCHCHCCIYYKPSCLQRLIFRYYSIQKFGTVQNQNFPTFEYFDRTAGITPGKNLPESSEMKQSQPCWLDIAPSGGL